jgi:hypothetical protein
LPDAPKGERAHTPCDPSITENALVDQLESLFAAAEQVGFTALLQRLAESGRVWLVFTLRSDRYAELQGDSALLDLKRRGIVYDLPPPGRSEIEVIVKGPARAAGLVLERRDGRSLVRKLVEDAPSADAL